jgi:hypothetical protein
MGRLTVKLGIALLLGVCASAQDIKLNVNYVCNGGRTYVENCTIRNVSDTSSCSGGASQTRLKFDNTRSEQRNPDQVKKIPSTENKNTKTRTMGL